MKKLLVVLVVVVAVLVAVKAGSGDKNNDPIKIGAILPMTGPAAFLGEDGQTGMKVALEVINSSGGINGQPIEIIFEDSESKADVGVSAFRKLVDIDDVDAVITSMSSVGAAVAPLAEELQIPVILGDSSHPTLPHDYDYAFRNFFTTRSANTVAINQFERDGVVRVASIYLNDEFGNAAYQDLMEQAENSSVEVVAGEAFLPSDPDVRTQLSKIKAAEPEVLYVFGVGPPMARVYQEAHELEVADTIAGFLVCGQGATFDNVRSATEGSLAMEPNVDLTSNEYREFERVYESMYPENTIGQFEYIHYDGVNVLARAYESGALTGAEVRDYILDTKTFRGVAGDIAYDRRGESSRNMKAQVIHDGKCQDIG